MQSKGHVMESISKNYREEESLLKAATKSDDPERDKSLVLLLVTALIDKKILHRKGTHSYYTVSKQESKKIEVSDPTSRTQLDLKKMQPDEFELVEDIPQIYEKCVATIEGIPKFTHEGYCIPSSRWNGWIYPSFEIKVAKQLMEAINNDKVLGNFYKISRDEEKGQFTVVEIEFGKVEVLKDEVIEVEGKEITVVSFMGGAWAWCGLFGEQANQTLLEAKKALNEGKEHD